MPDNKLKDEVDGFAISLGLKTRWEGEVLRRYMDFLGPYTISPVRNVPRNVRQRTSKRTICCFLLG